MNGEIPCKDCATYGSQSFCEAYGCAAPQHVPAELGESGLTDAEIDEDFARALARTYDLLAEAVPLVDAAFRAASDSRLGLCHFGKLLRNAQAHLRALAQETP